ncbi:MAG: C-type lectin domain-containing protein [Planctomycetota bacterium]
MNKIVFLFCGLSMFFLSRNTTFGQDPLASYSSERKVLVGQFLAAVRNLENTFAREITKLDERTKKELRSNLGELEQFGRHDEAQAIQTAMTKIDSSASDRAKQKSKLTDFAKNFVSMEGPKIDVSLTTSAGSQAPRIPGQAVHYKGHYYMVYGKGLPFSGAARYCHYLGGSLATVDDQAEYEFLRQLIARSVVDCEQFWLNGTDDMEEGVWRTIDGRKLPFEKWRPGEPSSTKNQEHYLSLNRTKGWGFNDSQGVYRSYGFICEWVPKKKE